MVEQVQILFQALGLTLLHFCWQGAIIALAAKLVSAALPNLRPRAQYAISLCAMLAMAAAAVATFAWEKVRLGRGEDALGQDAVALGAAVMPQGLDPMSLLPWVDAVWAAGVLALTLRTVNGLWAIHRLKANAQPVPEALAQRFARAARILGLSNVQIRMHAGIDSPFVVGIFRSVVYLPVSAVTTLSPDQIDAVLAHELEHIRRADFAWNLLQTVLETLFFYHPAVWWLGRRLREQRELACDDAAVRTCSDPLTYATALLRLEEQRRTTPHLAVALNGDGSGPSLLSRVRRILGDTPKGTQAMSPRKVSRPALLAAPVVLVTLAALAIPAAQVVAGPDSTLSKICNIKSRESITASSGLALSESTEAAGPESPAAEATEHDVEPKDFWAGLMPQNENASENDNAGDGRNTTWTWIADIHPDIDHEAIARAEVEGLTEAAEEVRREAEKLKTVDPVQFRELQATADSLAEQARAAQANARTQARAARADARAQARAAEADAKAQAKHSEVMAHNAERMAFHAERMQYEAEIQARNVEIDHEKIERIARKAEQAALKAEAHARKEAFRFSRSMPVPPAPPAVPALPALPAFEAPPAPPSPPAPPAKPMAVATSVIVRTQVVALPDGRIAVNVENMGRQPNVVPATTVDVRPAAKPAPIPTSQPRPEVVVSVERKVRIG